MSPWLTAQSCARTLRSGPTRWCSPPAAPTSRRSLWRTPVSTPSWCWRTWGAGRCSASLTSCTRGRPLCRSHSWPASSRRRRASRCEVWPRVIICRPGWASRPRPPTSPMATAGAGRATRPRPPLMTGTRAQSRVTRSVTVMRAAPCPEDTTMTGPARRAGRAESRPGPAEDLETASTPAWIWARLGPRPWDTTRGTPPTPTMATSRQRTWASDDPTAPGTLPPSTWSRWNSWSGTERGTTWRQTTSATKAWTATETTGRHTPSHTRTWTGQHFLMEVCIIFRNRYGQDHGLTVWYVLTSSSVISLMSNAPYLLQEALQALNFMASGGGLPHPPLPPPVHSPLHPLHSPGHFPGLSSLHKPHMSAQTSNSPSYNGEYRL